MGTATFNQANLGLTRSLTEVFILLRNNAQQSRHIFADAVSGSRAEDRLHLIPLDTDVESGNNAASAGRIPPEWVNVVDEIQYEMSRVRTRIKDMRELQQKHVTRPRFDDSVSVEERQIDASTQEITKMLTHCQRLVQVVHQSGSSERDVRLKKNVTSAVIQSLQQLTSEFRSQQTQYLKQIRSREDSCQQYFDVFNVDAAGGDGSDFGQIDTPKQGEEMTMAQLQMLEESTSHAKEREREILHISRSIVEVNQLFKDLGQFIVEQGTVLDRIDFNIDQSNVKVKSALKSVKKAEQYQKKNRKMVIIVTLAVIVIVLLVILIVVKR